MENAWACSLFGSPHTAATCWAVRLVVFFFDGSTTRALEPGRTTVVLHAALKRSNWSSKTVSISNAFYNKITTKYLKIDYNTLKVNSKAVIFDIKAVLDKNISDIRL